MESDSVTVSLKLCDFSQIDDFHSQPFVAHPACMSAFELYLLSTLSHVSAPSTVDGGTIDVFSLGLCSALVPLPLGVSLQFTFPWVIQLCSTLVFVSLLSHETCTDTAVS